MKLTLHDLVNSVPALRELQALKFPAPQAYRVTKALDECDAHLRTLSEAARKLPGN